MKNRFVFSQRGNLLALAILMTASLTVRAQEWAAPQQEVVGLGGETLFILRASQDLDKSARERSNDCYDRLRYILNDPLLKASDIQVKPLGNYGMKIVANGQLIIPIGAAEARAHDTTTRALAQEWVLHLRQILPSLTARPDLFAKSNAIYIKQKIARGEAPSL